MDKHRLSNILDLLRKYHGSIDLRRFVVSFVKNRSLFEFIVAVMLSQNTSDRNAIRAYRNLEKLLGEVSPEKVLSRGLEEIMEAVRVAGMYRERARRIFELAKLFSKPSFTEKLVEEIENSGVEAARRKLLELPGIGYKTADVLLLMYFNKPTFPVDTHIARITKRLGYLDRYDYESIRRFWMNVFDPRDYLEAHLLLITHGRRVCRARNPRCDICVIRSYCRYGGGS